jgi:hypothetical protein
MAHYDMDDLASIDALADDYTFFPDLGAFLTPDMLMEHGVAAAAGAGGILIANNVFDRVEFFADKPGYRAAAELLLGIAGGRALYNYNRPAAFGLIGGVSGLALASLVQMGLDRAMAAASEEAPAAAAATAGLRALAESTGVVPVPPYYDRYKTSVPTSFRGLAQPMVTGANYFQTKGMAGLGEGSEPDDTENENDADFPDVGTWLSGAF